MNKQPSSCLLIASVWGKEIQDIQQQIHIANTYCDGVELRSDLSFLTSENLLSLQQEIKGKIYLSEECADYHNYSQTPSTKTLWQILDLLMEKQKPYYKIACWAQSSLDALRMLLFIKQAKAKYSVPIIGLCMGDLGKITRILAPWVGCAATFTYIQKPSAEGQIIWNELLEKYSWRSISPQTQVFALLGDPIDHSPSDKTHNQMFVKNNLDAVYVKIKVTKEELAEALRLLQVLEFSGCSITIPHKERVTSLINNQKSCVQAIGAANTMFKDNATKTWGLANTDFLGGVQYLEKWVGPLNNKRFLILGAGGSARALVYGILQKGGCPIIWSRRHKQSLELAGSLGGIATPTPQVPYDVMINTTPTDFPSPDLVFHHKKFVCDIRLQKKSPLLNTAKTHQCSVKNGLEMFLAQAHWQFKIWDLIPF